MQSLNLVLCPFLWSAWSACRVHLMSVFAIGLGECLVLFSQPRHSPISVVSRRVHLMSSLLGSPNSNHVIPFIELVYVSVVSPSYNSSNLDIHPFLWSAGWLGVGTTLYMLYLVGGSAPKTIKCHTSLYMLSMPGEETPWFSYLWCP